MANFTVQFLGNPHQFLSDFFHKVFFSIFEKKVVTGQEDRKKKQKLPKNEGFFIFKKKKATNGLQTFYEKNMCDENLFFEL